MRTPADGSGWPHDRSGGLRGLDELPDASEFDPSPELEAELRDRLLRAGEARTGT